MIFILRLVIFSFLIFLGFHLSVRSKKGRVVVSVVYGCVLVWYTFLCRVHLYVNVSAADYTSNPVPMSTGEKILQLLKSIFGMQANGNLAGNYAQAFVLNCLLFVPMGYLVYLHFLCGDKTLSSLMNDAVTTGSDKITRERSTPEKRKLKRAAWSSILICIATSITIELLQGLTHLGTTDLLDILANTIGGGVGIFITLVWMKDHRCVGE